MLAQLCNSSLTLNIWRCTLTLHIPRWLIFAINILYIWCCILTHFSVACWLLYVILTPCYGSWLVLQATWKSLTLPHLMLLKLHINAKVNQLTVDKHMLTLWSNYYMMTQQERVETNIVFFILPVCMYSVLSVCKPIYWALCCPFFYWTFHTNAGRTGWGVPSFYLSWMRERERVV